MKIGRLGIEFIHKGDAILWIWPWKRLSSWNGRFISFGFDSVFSSLKEVDKAWDDYFLHMKNDKYFWYLENDLNEIPKP